MIVRKLKRNREFSFKKGIMGKGHLNKVLKEVREQALQIRGRSVCLVEGTANAKTLRLECTVMFEK